MASYISVPRDLTKVKSKIMFNLTKRQLICFSLAALIGVPSFFLLKRTGNIKFLRPKIRVYRTDNYYAALMRQAEVEREVEEIVSRYQEPVPAKGKKNLSGAGKS